jgi:hypothetical protein
MNILYNTQHFIAIDMGCSQSSVRTFEFTLDNVNKCDIKTNPLFNHKLSEERRVDLERQLTMHGGINHLLTINGFESQNNSFDAINSAYKNKLIKTPMLNFCKNFNKKGNCSKHNWTTELNTAQ